MPAPGEQHLNSGGKTITNPFEEVKPRISEYTAQDIMTLQSRLQKQLGPEFISSRAGPGGQKVWYLAAEKCIQLANDVFGFNGWSSQIMDVTVDYFDENSQTMKVNIGISVIVRVTLKDGTFHEDIGYGHMENAKSKAAAFEKAKKEGTTDALKRALRNFGNVLGNCIYDKEYLAKVTKIKPQPSKWDVERLHRHTDFTPVKKEPEPLKLVEEKSQNTAGIPPSITSEDTFDDEFGDFDEADFNLADSDAHPDEVVLPPQPQASRHFNGPRNTNFGMNGRPPNQNRPQQPMAAPPGRPQNAPPPQPQPQSPNNSLSRSTSGAGANMRPPADTNPPRPAQQPQAQPASRTLNRPSRNGPPSAPVSPARLPSSNDDAPLPPQGAGFFSARAAPMLPETTDVPGTTIPTHPNLPAFNPHAESPSIKRTPGVDHKSSKPLTRDLKHVPTPSQAAGPSKVVENPGLQGVRKIGAPGGGVGSPLGNRGSYKPPTFKRGVDGRPPLGDLPANGPIGDSGGGGGGDVKRQRLNG